MYDGYRASLDNLTLSVSVYVADTSLLPMRSFFTYSRVKQCSFNHCAASKHNADLVKKKNRGEAVLNQVLRVKWTGAVWMEVRARPAHEKTP